MLATSFAAATGLPQTADVAGNHMAAAIIEAADFCYWDKAPIRLTVEKGRKS